jgi:hypothetical protein
VKSKAITAASAAILSLALMAGTPALAQMELDEAVNGQLISLGFVPGDWVLTEEQVIELQNVLASNDTDGEKQEQVRKIVGID